MNKLSLIVFNIILNSVRGSLSKILVSKLIVSNPVNAASESYNVSLNLIVPFCLPIVL